MAAVLQLGRLSLFFVLICYSVGLFARVEEDTIFLKTDDVQGLPFIEHFHPERYLQLTPHFEHASIIQNDEGVTLIGSHGGVLMYSGNSWQMVEVPGNNMVWSLALDTATGRVYAGGSDNLGYLTRNEYGKFIFVSLLPQLPKNLGHLGYVWNTLVTAEGVFFKTNQHLIRWQNDSIKIWKAEEAFGTISWMDGRLYVHQLGKGLFVLQDEKLKLYSDASIFKEERPQLLLPLPDKRWLVSTQESGLSFFNGQQTEAVSSQVRAFLQGQAVFGGTLLPDGNIALATLKGGVIILDRQARIQSIFNKESGLVTNTVYLVSADQQDGLWVSSEKGLSRIRLRSPFSYFNEQNGLQRQAYAVSWHEGKLFAGTTDGLFVLTDKSAMGASATFRREADFRSSIWKLLSVSKSLLVASDEGLFEWKNGKMRSLSLTDIPWENYSHDLEVSRLDSSLVFVASKGFYVFQKKGENWVNQGKIPGLDANISQILQTPLADMWLLTEAGLARVQFNQTPAFSDIQEFVHHAQVSFYDKTRGLPAEVTRLYWMAGQLILQSGDVNPSLFTYDLHSDTFQPVSAAAPLLGLSGYHLHPALEYQGTDSLWLWARKQHATNRELMLATENSTGGYHVTDFDFSGTTHAFRYFAYAQQDQALWYAGVDGLVRFAWKQATTNSYPFSTLLERVVLPGDSVLYPASQQKVVLPYGSNTLRFELAAPSYNGTQDQQFQYWLEGYEKAWSAWSSESVKTYTRLPEGDYVLHAQAVSPRGQKGTPVTYAFTILPPWYRTLLMYGLYVVFTAGMVWMLIRWRSSRLEAEKQALEKLIDARTKEVAQKNEQLQLQTLALERQTLKLKELDEVKTNFYANVSHEFRTPLSLIINPVQDKLLQYQKNDTQHPVSMTASELEVMYRNGNRLLELINQLLDLSKLESGKMSVALLPGDLSRHIRQVYASFSSLAHSRQVQFTLKLTEEPLLCQYDQDKVEKILNNLLSNAFKFCPPQGEVIFETCLISPEEPSGTGTVQIRVQDNGPGLNAEQKQQVFERFYRGKQYYADVQGTGIGLALTKELVELHEGKIWVESEEGKGASFIFEIPYLPAADTFSTDLQANAVHSYPVSQESRDINSEQDALLKKEVPSEIPVILIVEDNADLRSYIRYHLQARYKVMECDNGSKGLALARQWMPDLIISDWMMPEMDGIALCEQLRQDVRTSHIPLIMLTALSSMEAKMKGLTTGADDYLTKPFSAQELLIRVRNLLEARRRMREHYSRMVRLEPRHVLIESADEKFLQNIMQIVEERMGDAAFSVDEFSREAGLSRVHLHRKLKALTGQAPSDFVRMIRLKKAEHLLKARAGNVAEVAYQVGFNNLSYFSKCFKETFGVLPHAYADKKAIP